MKRSALAATVAVAAVVVLTPSLAASAAPSNQPHTLPQQVSAPYLDVTSVPSIAAVSAESGAKYLSLAFLQTDAPGSCSLYWAGQSSLSVASDALGTDIAKIQNAGGDVIPSFGGYTADTTNTEIAQSCTDVSAIARAYEQVFTTYKVTRLDFDVEADAINDTAANDRRNAAIVEVEKWGAATHHAVSFSYTLPSTPNGLAASGLAVLQSAADAGAQIASVNLMTFDYWDGVQHDMTADAETAVAGLAAQLQSTLFPDLNAQQLARHEGVIQMIGIDDFGPTETFTVAQAKQFESWAASKHLAYIGFWAVNRDHGTCVGQAGGYACSGVAQNDWDFTRAFAPFTTGA
ncbi:MAG: chitinase [Microbacteriaceae bacterium]|nr:chitinase [Microbacteriaceae bacterium]MCL2794075.1 chitinase [Microbacteriaceae bacterium]